MRLDNLDIAYTDAVRGLMLLGAPYVQARTPSDYWLYARLFSNTCPIISAGEGVLGAAIAFRSQTTPEDIYVQDVMVDPQHRQRGIAGMLLGQIARQAQSWECRRLYLTSEPTNKAAHRTWLALGFTNIQGDDILDDISITRDFKGPGKHRSVYEMLLRR